MRKTLSILLVALSFIGTAAAQQASVKETKEQRDQRMSWWRNDRFGMFIHWGIYAQFGGFYRGHSQKVNNGEWLMNRMKVPVQEYKDTAQHFNPVKFNADDWARMAKEAGMKYMVITAKHHDGFALFDTRASDWNIIDATPYKKDVIKALAEACKKQGLRFGIYYSQDQDWGNPGGATGRRVMKQGWENPDSAKIDAYTLAHGGSWDPVQQTKTFDQYFDAIVYPQMKELMSNYGKISTIFWDTPNKIKPEQAEKLMILVKQNNPNIITNDRLIRKPQLGDYKTPEKKIPDLAELDGKDWETNMTMNDTWGYRTDDHKWKSTEVLLHQLIDIASKGGNFLLNIGPKPDGTFPHESVTRLKEIGIWIKKYGEAIYGTHANPIDAPDWGRITAKDKNGATTLYLSVFNWPANGKLEISGLNNKAVNAALFGQNTRLTLTQAANGKLQISGLPKVAPDKYASVIEVKLDDLAKKEFKQETKMKTGSID